MGLGGALGGLVAAAGLPGFVTLFLANAVTYVLYVAILVVVVPEDVRPARSRAATGSCSATGPSSGWR